MVQINSSRIILFGFHIIFIIIIITHKTLSGIRYFMILPFFPIPTGIPIRMSTSGMRKTGIDQDRLLFLIESHIPNPGLIECFCCIVNFIGLTWHHGLIKAIRNNFAVCFSQFPFFIHHKINRIRCSITRMGICKSKENFIFMISRNFHIRTTTLPKNRVIDYNRYRITPGFKIICRYKSRFKITSSKEEIRPVIF